MPPKPHRCFMGKKCPWPNAPNCGHKQTPLQKAEQRVLKAAKVWAKMFESTKTNHGTYIYHIPTEIKLRVAIKKLERLENEE